MDPKTIDCILRGLRAYQGEAMSLAVYGEKAKLSYPVIGLVSEVGEIADVMKRVIRDHDGNLSPEDNVKMRNELGDSAWYLAAIARDLGTDLGSIAIKNLVKLRRRRDEGTLRTREGR